MAKAQVTEEELAKGLQGMGSMSALSSKQGKPKRDNPFRDTRSEVSETKKTQVEESVSVEVEQEKSIEKPVIVPPETTLVVEKVVAPESKEEAIPKSAVYEERVTVPFSSETKINLDLLAKELQKIRPEKKERITANTIVRVAVEALLKNYKTTPVSTEEELLQEVNKQFQK